MGKLNLRSQHVSCLYYLYTYGKLTSKEIVKISLEDKGQVSRTLDYLETNGYVSCDSDAKKRYNAYFSLTEKGMACGEEVANKINSFLSIAGKGISDEDRAIMEQFEKEDNTDFCLSMDKLGLPKKKLSAHK